MPALHWSRPSRRCLRYEIRDISPPAPVQRAMEMQAEAERRKRAQILESEGEQQSVINRAEAAKRDIVLRSEAHRQERANAAQGEAEYLRTTAEATAASLERVAAAFKAEGAADAASLRVAEQYVEAFAKLASTSSTMLLPGNPADASGMVAQALGVFKHVGAGQALGGAAAGGGARE